MRTSTTFAALIFTTCKVVYLTSTWKDFMHDGDGIDNAMSISVPLESVGDGYKHKISIGSKNQDFDVMVTLSSSMLWVPRIGCTGVGSREQFNWTQSTSFARDGRPWTQKSYGGTITGELGNDVVTIRGSVTQQLKPKCTFGMATSISADAKLPVDGVLGLAPNNDSSNPTPTKPFIIQLIETRDLLNSPMFTIFLSQQSGSNAGSVTYGSRNAINCQTGSATLQPFTNSYQFKMSSISLGNFTHTFMSNAMPELISSIIGPQAEIDGLAKAAGAMPKLGSYEIQCNATVPKLEIKAERFYTIQSNRLIVKMGNRCILALAPQTSAGIGPQWHFGAPLLQEYCITFNLNTNNLEFFGVKSGSTTTSSTLRTASTPKQNTTSASKTTRRIPTTTPKNTTSSSTKTTRSTFYYTKNEYHHLVNENNSQNPDYYTKKKHYYFVNELFNKNYTQSTFYYTKNEYHHLVNENNSQNPDYYTKKKHYYFVNENNSPTPNYYTKKNQHLLNENDSQNDIHHIKEKCNHL